LQFKEENELFRDVSTLLRNVFQEYIDKIRKNLKNHPLHSVAIRVILIP
jgi:hypothetical protein